MRRLRVSVVFCALLGACADFTDSAESKASRPADHSESTGGDTGSSGGSSGSGDGSGDGTGGESDGGQGDDGGTGGDDGGGSDSGQVTDTGDGLAPAGDYTEPGPWTPGNLTEIIDGTDGISMYLDVWYPSADTGTEIREYGWTGWYNTGGSYTDVSPSCEAPLPVMLHSHGNQSVRFEMFYLPEFLSTHGWLVAGPDHTGNTLYANTLPFGTILFRRPVDVQDTFDWLVEQSADAGSGLYGCVDPDAGYVVSGYSFGGYTAYANGGALINNNAGTPTYDISDDRVTAVVTFAPWDAYGYMSSGTAEVEVPVLTLGGERDATVGTDYRDLFDPVTSVPRAMGIFDNAGHYSFTPIYCTGSGDGCGGSYMDQDAFVEVVKTSVLSFVEHLRSRPGAIEQMPVDKSEYSWEMVLK